MEFQSRRTSLEQYKKVRIPPHHTHTFYVVSMLIYWFDLLKHHRFNISPFSISTESLITCSRGRRPEEGTVDGDRGQGTGVIVSPVWLPVRLLWTPLSWDAWLRCADSATRGLYFSRCEKTSVRK